MFSKIQGIESKIKAIMLQKTIKLNNLKLLTWLTDKWKGEMGKQTAATAQKLSCVDLQGSSSWFWC